jgi:hypothetical protein
MWTSVERDDASLVNHLDMNRDVVARLDQLDVLVVPARDDWGPGVEPDDTPLVNGKVLGVFGGSASRAPNVLSLLSGRRHRRNLPVGRIHDE